MLFRISKRPLVYLIICILVALSSKTHASEKIIQKEKMSFERCKEVIKISAEKLVIEPVISDPEPTLRIAVFNLIDGTLTITCDGKDNRLIVSTNVSN